MERERRDRRERQNEERDNREGAYKCGVKGLMSAKLLEGLTWGMFLQAV